MSKINDCQVAQIAIFCPEADENVYLQWFNDDPSDGANGPIFQFLTVFKSDGDAYTQTDGEVSKFKCSDCGCPLTDSLLALAERTSNRLGLTQDLAVETLKFIDALLCDEADDLDESRFDYRWVDYPNAFLGFNNELGRPQNRIHIKVKSNQWAEGVDVVVNHDSLAFDTDSLGLALAISQFTQVG